MGTLDIHIESDPKGGNPGGLGMISVAGNVKQAYLKYCPGSRMRPGTKLTAVHQPIYEALTFQLAQKIGLHIPENYVIDNREHIARFTYDPGLRREFNDKMPFYFASIMAPDPRLDATEESNLTRLINEEEPYRQFLMIDDIQTKRQNYSISDGFPIYFDLGCSFVRAVQGMLWQKNSKHYDASKAELKQATKRIKPFYLVKRGTESFMKLSDLVESIPTIEIPVINGPFKTSMVPLDKLLGEEEIIEIVNDHSIHIEASAAKIYKEVRYNLRPILLKSYD